MVNFVLPQGSTEHTIFRLTTNRRELNEDKENLGDRTLGLFVRKRGDTFEL